MSPRVRRSFSVRGTQLLCDGALYYLGTCCQHLQFSWAVRSVQNVGLIGESRRGASPFEGQARGCSSSCQGGLHTFLLVPLTADSLGLVFFASLSHPQLAHPYLITLLPWWKPFTSRVETRLLCTMDRLFLSWPWLASLAPASACPAVHTFMYPTRPCVTHERKLSNPLYLL